MCVDQTAGLDAPLAGADTELSRELGLTFEDGERARLYVRAQRGGREVRRLRDREPYRSEDALPCAGLVTDEEDGLRCGRERKRENERRGYPQK